MNWTYCEASDCMGSRPHLSMRTISETPQSSGQEGVLTFKASPMAVGKLLACS